ncbi:unnamed protein product, partial [Cylicostephanus goldi]
GVFGQCYSPNSGAPTPTVIDHLDDTQLELLRLELTRLAKQDLDWSDQRSQCVLSYFKLSMYYGLQYDPDFCQVRNPANIWALIQLIEMGLNDNEVGSNGMSGIEQIDQNGENYSNDENAVDGSNDQIIVDEATYRKLTIPFQPIIPGSENDGTVDGIVPLEQQQQQSQQEVDNSENETAGTEAGADAAAPEEDIQSILERIQGPPPQLDIDG